MVPLSASIIMSWSHLRVTTNITKGNDPPPKKSALTKDYFKSHIIQYINDKCFLLIKNSNESINQ